MSKQNVLPIIAAKHPAKVDLEAGKDYYWCRWGKSQTGPFCDGSHATLGALEPGDVALVPTRSGRFQASGGSGA